MKDLTFDSRETESDFHCFASIKNLNLKLNLTVTRSQCSIIWRIFLTKKQQQQQQRIDLMTDLVEDRIPVEKDIKLSVS